ncbi:hypothetical protein [Actinomadura sp. NTSP31]|uniref:hypothetical protein n=1 Tax=Actinomadura sp. NTSP31 TaxID=1735447 RepID=UPI0035C13D0D
MLGSSPAAGPSHLARVGFVAQDTPVYGSFSVADHLRMGAPLIARGLETGTHRLVWNQSVTRRR